MIAQSKKTGLRVNQPEVKGSTCTAENLTSIYGLQTTATIGQSADGGLIASLASNDDPTDYNNGWYLPAPDQMSTMYDNRATIGFPADSPTNYYLSSQNVDATNATWTQFDTAYAAGPGPKNSDPRSRCTKLLVVN